VTLEWQCHCVLLTTAFDYSADWLDLPSLPDEQRRC
jgi:hypothetical protein